MGDLNVVLQKMDLRGKGGSGSKIHALFVLIIIGVDGQCQDNFSIREPFKMRTLGLAHNNRKYLVGCKEK